jgi:hypothetical protein
MSKDSKFQDGNDVKEEKAWAGFQAAIALWIYQGQLNWNRFNVMLVANSLIIAIIGSVFSSQRPLPYLAIALALGGIGLCVAWVLLTARGFDYHRYWGLCAWELEEQHLSDVVTIVSRLDSFRNGGEVAFQIRQGETKNDEKTTKKYRLGKLSKVSQRLITYSVIVAFAIAYLVVVVYDILVLLAIL